MTQEIGSADAALYFQALPRVPLMLMFWDAEPEDDFEAEARLLFDETVTDQSSIVRTAPTVSSRQLQDRARCRWVNSVV